MLVTQRLHKRPRALAQEGAIQTNDFGARSLQFTPALLLANVKRTRH